MNKDNYYKMLKEEAEQRLWSEIRTIKRKKVLIA